MPKISILIEKKYRAETLLKSDSYDESFDLEQYEREGGNEDSQRIKRDDISGMRREVGNLEVSQNIRVSE